MFKHDGDAFYRRFLFYRCLLWSPPSREKLKVDYSNYLSTRNNVVCDEEGEVEDDEVATA